MASWYSPRDHLHDIIYTYYFPVQSRAVLLAVLGGVFGLIVQSTLRR